MVLNNVIMADDGRNASIQVSGGKITKVVEASADGLIKRGEHTPAPLSRGESHRPPGVSDEFAINFTDAVIFPGLINSHDHLDFDLFPQFGDKVYNNYTKWGAYIHKQYKEEIAEVLKVPQALRSRWGMYKNLLCGVTTVVNHGSGSEIADKLIDIFDEKHDLHSVGFDKQWKLRLNNPLKRKLPVVIHAGEGTDEAAKNEIDKLISNNRFRRNLVAVHGVAMRPEQARHFKALVWCPESNYFLLNKTAPVDELKKHTQLLFGTDSTLTGRWDIWQHINFARETGMLRDGELYQTLNTNAADVWGLNTGRIEIGKDADIVVAKMTGKAQPMAAFFAIKPADILLVMHKGEMRLIDETIIAQLKPIDLNNYNRIYIDGRCKYVEGDLKGLVEAIKNYYPAADLPISFNE